MKKLILLLLLIIVLIPACTKNPVYYEAPKQPVDLKWENIYTNINPITINAGINESISLPVAAGDFSNGLLIKIRLKYISYYNTNQLSPTMWLSNGHFYSYLKNNTYSILDTTVSGSSFSGMLTAFISVSNAKITFDTLMILKGNLNY